MATAKHYPFQNKNLADIRNEVWKDIPNFEGIYMASSMGRIKSLDRVIPHPRLLEQFVQGKVLSQSIASNRNLKTGVPMIDLRVSLSNEGKQYYFNTRRLVYLTFVDPNLDYNEDTLYIINKDGDGYNNRLSNLQAVSRSEKQQRVFSRNRHDTYLKTADRTKWPKTFGGYARRKPVKQYLKGRLVGVFESVSAAAKATGCDEKGIIQTAKGVHSHCGGFKWKYVN